MLGKVVEPVVYYGDQDIDPEDVQLTNGIQFLISKRVHDIFSKFNVRMESFRSEIVFPNGRRIFDFFSVNFLDVFCAVDRKRSRFQADPDFPDEKIYEVEHLVLSKSKLPNSALFILRENVSYILVNEDLRNEFLRQRITGIECQEVELA